MPLFDNIKMLEIMYTRLKFVFSCMNDLYFLTNVFAFAFMADSSLPIVFALSTLFISALSTSANLPP